MTTVGGSPWLASASDGVSSRRSRQLWHRELVSRKWTYPPARRLGRPVRRPRYAAVQGMAAENPSWGYTAAPWGDRHRQEARSSGDPPSWCPTQEVACCPRIRGGDRQRRDGYELTGRMEANRGADPLAMGGGIGFHSAHRSRERPGVGNLSSTCQRTASGPGGGGGWADRVTPTRQPAIVAPDCRNCPKPPSSPRVSGTCATLRQREPDAQRRSLFRGRPPRRRPFLPSSDRD